MRPNGMGIEEQSSATEFFYFQKEMNLITRYNIFCLMSLFALELRTTVVYMIAFVSVNNLENQTLRIDLSWNDSAAQTSIIYITLKILRKFFSRLEKIEGTV